LQSYDVTQVFAPCIVDPRGARGG